MGLFVRSSKSSVSFGLVCIRRGVLGVVGFLCIGEVSLGRNLVSSGSFGFALVHSGAVVGFIRDRVNSVGRA